jgi:Kef-type K+ transport system membrane component KefB
MTNIFADVALILATSTILAAIFSRLRQPVMLSYLVVGILAASAGLFKSTGGLNLNFFSELGIAFTLFLIGLELRFSDIKQIGQAAVTIGIAQIIFTWFAGFGIAKLLGFATNDAIILSLALTFSSTIVVVKLLGERRQLDSLFGKITVGYLLVQDFIAIAALIFVTSLGREFKPGQFFVTAIEGTFLVILILVLNRFVLQKLFDFFARNSEVLFLAGISWALIFATLYAASGFSIEIGAFLAGLGLANLREQAQIASWVRPLRDFFITLFFLSLGLKLPLASLVPVLGPVSVLSIFVLIGNPLIMMIILGVLGYRRRTSFQVSITSSQVSEFSFILIFLAFRAGLISNPVVAATSATAIITLILSTYLITYSSKIYRLFSPYLKIFERKTLVERPWEGLEEFSDHVVLVGVGRLGQNILKGLKKRDLSAVVVDFNPNAVEKLQEEKIPVIYGDISDPEIFEKAIGKNTKMIISTVPDREDNRTILTEVKNLEDKFPVVVTSADSNEALEFYKEGAAYVIIPRILSSHLVERFLMDDQFRDLKDGSLRKEHIEELGSQYLNIT